MSQSPTDDSLEEGGDAYVLGWSAINRLMRSGHSWSGNERNTVYLNLGERSFADVSHLSGFGQVCDGRALATIDLDLDGDLDLVATSRDTPRVRVTRNESRSEEDRRRGVIVLRLRGTRCNRLAIGARVVVRFANGREPLVRGVRAGEGYLAQSSTWVHLQVGEEELEEVRVHWPGGASERIEGLAPGELWEVVQDSGRATRLDLPSTPLSLPAIEAPAPDELELRMVLATPVPLPELTIAPPDASAQPGAAVPLFGVRPGGQGTGTGRPVLLNLWSAGCAPCVRELRAFTARSEDLDAAGVAFLALSVDEDLAAAGARLESVGWPYAWASATQATLETLDALHGVLFDTYEPMVLPTSFLIDPGGQLRAVYRGPIEPDELLRDLQLVDLDDAAQLDAATPFDGRWYLRPGRDLEHFRGKLAARGLPEVATEYARGAIEVRQRSRAEMLHDFARDQARQGRIEAAIATLRSALEEDPDLFQARFDLGLLLQRTEQPHEAIAAYLRAAELEPEHEDTRFNLAIAYLVTRQLRSAKGQLAVLRELESPLADQLAALIERTEAEADR